MPDCDMVFRVLIPAESVGSPVQTFNGTDHTAVFDTADIEGDSFRIECAGNWVIMCQTSSFDTVGGTVVANVANVAYGEYTVDVRPVDGGTIGDISVRLPYLGHVGEIVKVKVIGASGSSVERCMCYESDGRTYLTVNTPSVALCQIIGVESTPEEGSDVPLMYIVLSVSALSLAAIAVLVLRRIRS